MNMYERAGVSIDAGKRAVDLIKEAVASTYGPSVLAGVGAFGGLFSMEGVLTARPALVASTDGVGTKVKIAAALGRYDTIGHDIVNHCVNDILCAGAGVRPLFFLDYIASSKLDPTIVARIVVGIAEACRIAGCALLGGETAEMPGVYLPGEFDLVGTIVGVVDQERTFPTRNLAPGDLLLGLPSAGAHTNGYSLIRAIFEQTPLDTVFEGVGPLGEALLVPHRSYQMEVGALHVTLRVKALAHITGGGLVENVPRPLAAFPGLTVRFKGQSWPVPPLFQLIQNEGDVDDAEMLRVFNMGIGMVAFIDANSAAPALAALGGAGWIIGEVIEGQEIEWE